MSTDKFPVWVVYKQEVLKGERCHSNSENDLQAKLICEREGSVAKQKKTSKAHGDLEQGSGQHRGWGIGKIFLAFVGQLTVL